MKGIIKSKTSIIKSKTIKKEINKKGITNIEMIVAATLFIFSVVIVIYYLNFVGIKEEPSDVFLNSLEQKLRNESEINYKIIYLKVSQTNGCFNVSKHADMSNNENFSFISANGESRKFNVSNEWLLIEPTNGENNYVIYSFPFNVTKSDRLFSQSPCTSLIKGQDYNYSISYQDKIFVFENITALGNNYNELKAKWGFQKDFAINITDGSNVLFNISGTKALQVPVKAKQFPIKVINKTGMIFDAFVNLQIW